MTLLVVNTTGLVTFQNNSYLGAIDYAVNTLVGANGPLGLNHLANLATNNTGTLLIPNVTEYLPKLHLDTLLPYTMVCNNAIRASLIVVKKLGNYGNITIGFYSMNVSGLNTWSNVDLFEPVDDYSLDFTTALSGVRLSVHFYIDLDVLNGSEPTEQTAPTVHGEGLLKMNLSSTAFRTLFFMGLDGAKLQGLSANQLMSPTCILSSVRTLCIQYCTFDTLDYLTTFICAASNIKLNCERHRSDSFWVRGSNSGRLAGGQFHRNHDHCFCSFLRSTAFQLHIEQ